MIAWMRPLLATTIFSLAVTAAPALAEAWQVTIQNPAGDLGETPILVEAKAPAGSYQVKSEDGATVAPAQVFEDGGKTYFAAVLPALKKGETHLSLTPDTGAEGGVTLKDTGPNVDVTVNGKPLTQYLSKTGPKPYFFPVLGPTGDRYTRAFPTEEVEGEKRDHPHQRSFWFTHGKVNGIDFWSELPGHGSIKETSRQAVISGPAVGVLHTTDDWIGPDGKKVCEDERVARFYATKGTRVIDFDIVIRATDGPVTFGDTKEGMFGVRVATSMDVDGKKGGKITNAEGLTDGDAWGKPSPWVDYTGPVAGKTAGLAILNHPDSFRYPTTWHVRTYGLFAANPFGLHDFDPKANVKGDHTIPAGESIAFRYRVILHEGETATAHLDMANAAYATPPTVTIAPAK